MGVMPDRRLEAWVIVCPRCSKENQDHYKFCLGCGAELTAPKPGSDMGMMKTMMADPGQSPLAGAPLGAPRGPSGAMPGQKVK